MLGGLFFFKEKTEEEEASNRSEMCFNFHEQVPSCFCRKYKYNNKKLVFLFCKVYFTWKYNKIIYIIF